MDVFERVRDVNAGLTLTEDRVSAARLRLLQGIDDSRNAERKRLARRPMFVIAGAVTGVAAVTAGVVVVGQMTAPSPQVEAIPTFAPTPPPSPSTGDPFERATVASVLESAAGATVAGGALEAAPGQYLRVEHQTTQLVLYQPTDQYTKWDATRASATAAWTASGTYFTYIPGDRSQEWVTLFEPKTTIGQTFGAGADALATEWLGTTLQEQIIDRHAGGIDDGSDPQTGSDAYYAQIPRDPQQLLDWYRTFMIGDVLDEDSQIASMIIQELQRNAAPADLRAAMLLALRAMPNGKIVSVDGSLVTLEFSFTWTSDRFDSWTDTLTVDTSSGFVSASSRTLGSEGTLVPAAVPNFSVVTSISIVDDAP
ncbi:hypothetical protein [Microbacterium sp. Leaf159]|uniref:hypothetical protein n=1 Tax=Microbacterium sp. Leaf159 TaxID=1736279 RepID=UPI0006F41366|nr:hypothetical protein [Microbacterium sp. Leaf159]KQR38050.1 hypothetical protein ASF80_00400 [Microbacterium sp. Leaf159]